MITRLLLLSLLLSTSCGTPTREPGPELESHLSRLSAAEQALGPEAQARMESARSVRSFLCGLMDSQGVMWFGTAGGVLRLDCESLVPLLAESGLASESVYAIAESHDGDLWFGTTDGLYRSNGETVTHVPIPWGDISNPWVENFYPIMNPNQVTALLQDKGGDLWLGTAGGGAFRYDGESFTSYLSEDGTLYEDGLYHNWISSLAEDRAGNIWLTSMSGGGVTRIDGEQLTQYMPEQGLSDHFVRSSLVDSEGKLWFGSSGNRDGGLDRFDGQTFAKMNGTSDALRGHISCIFEDQSGLLWLGCGVDGLMMYRGGVFTPLLGEDGQVFEDIQFVTEDAAGHIWFGGVKGQLYRFDGDSVHDYSTD
jgi:ligand-binding sensor domain-containing protein